MIEAKLRTIIRAFSAKISISIIGVQNLAVFLTKVEEKKCSTVVCRGFPNYSDTVGFLYGHKFKARVCLGSKRNNTRQKEISAAISAAFLLLLVGLPLFVFAEEDLEAQRLRGFYEQKQRNENHDEKRQAGAEQVTKAREKWEKERELSIAEYKKDKLNQRKRIDEDSPQYYQDLGVRVKRIEDRELDQAQFVKERNQYLSQKKGVRLSEMVEYGLNEKPERIDPKKREELSKKIAKSSGGSLAGKSSGGSSGGFTSSAGEAPPPIPAPSTPPEFFDGEAPPPPPPPLDGFDEPPPPPIFDDPDF